MVCELTAPPHPALASESLNPCFNGIWSASLSEEIIKLYSWEVLILVLMEYGLRVYLL